ncbi:MAG TPA: aromatic ring-hydroxylating dioxygenase subunit alpha [Acidimicrobiia bacterium]|nr:aromatic ring-hydroxylating dioxygenase subunit alpha [Acidimicrobiia bacterium]
MAMSLNVTPSLEFVPSDLFHQDRVHRTIYTDPRVFDAEMDRIFGTTWLYVGHESEITSAGDYKTTYMGRQPVIVSRAEDGSVHVLYNRCTHRAATVCQSERGNSSFFRCDYHGWTFRNDGTIIGQTFASGYDPRDCERAEFNLVAVPRVESYRGMIFASMAADGPTLDEHLGNAKEFIDLFMDLSPVGEIEVNTGVHRYTYGANWKLQSENGVDGYHPNFVHQAFLASTNRMTGAMGDLAMKLFHDSSPGRSADLGNGHGLLDSRPNVQPLLKEMLPTTEQGRAYLKVLADRLGSEERALEVASTNGAGGFNLMIFPNLLMIGVQIRVVHPRSVDRTDVELYATTLKGMPEEMNAGRLRGHEAFYGPAGGGAPDDLEMFERVQEGLKVSAVEWLPLIRGLRRGTVDERGIDWGHVTDEQSQRAFHRQWVRVMEGTQA